MGLFDSVSNALSLFYGGVKPLVWPKPLGIKCYPGGNGSGNAGFIPDLNSADGAGWSLGNLGATLVRIGATGSTVYTVTPAADINAAATQINAVFVDYANSKIYMLASNGGTNLYLAYSTLAAKAMTVRAMTTNPFTGNSVGFALNRSGSDFIVYADTGTIGAPAMQSATLTESTGAIAAASAFRLGGVAVGGYVTHNPCGFYVSADASIVMTIRASGANQQPLMLLQRGGSFANLPLSVTNYPLVFSYTGVGSYAHGAIINGDAVTLASGINLSENIINFPRHYSRSDFDAFLNRACDYAGILR